MKHFPNNFNFPIKVYIFPDFSLCYNYHGVCW